MTRGLAASKPGCGGAGNLPETFHLVPQSIRTVSRVSQVSLRPVLNISLAFQPLRSELRKGAKSAVPLADRAIGNLQQWLIGTYHGVSKAQLQVYLDEFVFRHNRRKTPAAAFQTLLGLGTGRKSTEYEQIRGARDLNPQPVGGS